jgi:preprotein translocase subunit YajC
MEPKFKKGDRVVIDVAWSTFDGYQGEITHVWSSVAFQYSIKLDTEEDEIMFSEEEIKEEKEEKESDA